MATGNVQKIWWSSAASGQTDKRKYFGNIFDKQLCIATVVDRRFKLSSFDSADHRRCALEATVWAMETTTSSLNEGPFTLRTFTDVDVPKGRMSTSTTTHYHTSTCVNVCSHAWTHVDVCRRTSPHTVTDTYNMCKCYMLMNNDIQRGSLFMSLFYVIKMQVKHVIISNLIIVCYYCGNGWWRVLLRVNARHDAL